MQSRSSHHVVRKPWAADRDRRRRYAHYLDASRPYRRAHHHYLQTRRPLRRGSAGKTQLVSARLAPQPVDPHGPSPDRSALGGATGDRIERVDRHRVRLSLTANQFDAAAAKPRRRAFLPAHARPRYRLLYSRRAARGDPRNRPAAAARRRRLLSDFGVTIRAHGYRRSADVAAHDAKRVAARFPQRPHGVSAG